MLPLAAGRGPQAVVMLEATALAFGFPGRTVGEGIDFALARGEAMCVLGPNGSGKTTLFRTLLGLLPARAGAVRVDGCDSSSLSRREFAQLVGYVPQAHATSFPFSVADIVLMGRAAHLGALASPSAPDRHAAMRALEEAGIAQLAARNYMAISGGERQLVLIARALAQEPKVLVMDEPTASLDFGNQMRVLEKMRSLAQSGIAIMFSTHDPDHAFSAADRAMLLGGGRMLGIGTPDEVIRPEALEALYGVPVRIVRAPDGLTVCKAVPPPLA